MIRVSDDPRRFHYRLTHGLLNGLFGLEKCARGGFPGRQHRFLVRLACMPGYSDLRIDTLPFLLLHPKLSLFLLIVSLLRVFLSIFGSNGFFHIRVPYRP